MSAIQNDRAVMPDLVRAFALVGIALVNVAIFAWPMVTHYYDGALDQPADSAVFLGMTGLFLMKSYPLFSMMFGAGLAYQLASAQRAGADFAPRYFRRMIALIVLGLLHFVFFWIGDILLTYGLLGCILFAMRDFSAKTLVRLGIVLIVVNALILVLIASAVHLAESFAPDVFADMGLEALDAEARAAFGEGSFWQAAAYRLKILPETLPGVIFQQGFGVLGFFCFGLAAVKAGVIDQPDALIWRWSRMVMLPFGLAGSFAGAWLMLTASGLIDSRSLYGMAVLMAFSPFSALGYIGLIALFSKGPAGPIKSFFARAGSASLTAYLLQSLLFSLIFSAYGLGQFARMSAAEATATAFAVAAASLVFVAMWRSFAPRGPMEVVLRRFTYWGR